MFVEFSKYGNACYIYKYDDFNNKIAYNYMTRNSRDSFDIGALKEESIAVKKIRHISGWSEKLADIIDNYVLKDRTII